MSILEKNQPRDDYRELLQHSLIYLGHAPPRVVHLTKSAAMHRARWMAKSIYSLKIFCFISRLHLTGSETNMLRMLNLFICFIYLKCWFTAPFSFQFPLNDLKCLQRLTNHQVFILTHSHVADVATNALLRHT